MNSSLNKRLNSLDIFRGGIILLLLLESVCFFEILQETFEGNRVFSAILDQFFHAPWEGLNFWDIIQPGFMYIAGAAMALSLVKRTENGESHNQWLFHILKRSLILFLLGTGLHWVYNEGPVFELQNVLTQLAFTTLIAAMVIRQNFVVQFSLSIGLIILSSAIYRLYNSGAPFLPGRNAGSALDLILSGHRDSDHWVALNFLPTTAHTIWGAITAQILISGRNIRSKIFIPAIAAIVCIVFGLFLHISGLEPIIKRISTASFVLVSGGIVTLLFLVFYFLVDYREIKETKVLRFFMLPGRNCIFIYLFSQIVIPMFLFDLISIFTFGFGEILHAPEFISISFTILAVLIIVWNILTWFYRKKIIIRI